MTMPLMLLLAMVVMYAVGFTLMLDRGLTRILLGFLLVGNATNLLMFLSGGRFGLAAFMDGRDEDAMADPLPQAFILTAIVITFGITAFLLALMYRQYRLDKEEAEAYGEAGGDDIVRDDADDRELAREAAITSDEVTQEDLSSGSDFESDLAGLEAEENADNHAVQVKPSYGEDAEEGGER